MILNCMRPAPRKMESTIHTTYLQICIAVSHNHFDGVQYPLECVPCTFPLKIAKMSTFIMKLCTF